MSESKNEYIPGVCNIGRAEVRLRKRVAWLGLGVTLGVAIALRYFEFPPLLRFLIFIPAFTSAMGFLQSAWGFCAMFGLLGVRNFGPNAGKSDTIEQANHRNQDRQTAIKIVTLAAAIGLAVSIGYYLMPW